MTEIGRSSVKSVGVMLATLLSALLAQATASPTATPCQAEAEVVRAIPPKDFDLWPYEGAAFYATVLVLIGPDGKVEKASLYQPSGNLQFDMASIRAAKKSTFKPKLIDCKPVEGTFLFKTSLTPRPVF
jgi:TonB family protein